MLAGRRPDCISRKNDHIDLTTCEAQRPVTQNTPEPDIDPSETSEWLQSIDSVIRVHGPERAHYLIEQLVDRTRRSGAYLPYSHNTAYLNTIPVHQQAPFPGDIAIEKRILAYLRWNAMATVLHANKISSEYGGHIATYASSATLYEVGFNHFWRARNEDFLGDMIFMQGHSSPGIYARAFMEGRLEEKDLRRFRREVDGGGLSSYPHPWLMPDFWQFPTVSMGLGPMMAIYQARYMRYLQNRGMLENSDRKVWCFCGDGEMDEPESMGALTMPVREKLDNLVFVINCNLQRLDGPVRGNGKIIQELESAFGGAGWNVIKVLWGSRWDPLLAKDRQGLLQQRMEEAVDGEYQNFKQKGGAYTREHFFGKYPELAAMVANMSDADIWRLNRGGHDVEKVYAAYHQAMQPSGRPTVILAKTVKGFGMGAAGEGQNITHQKKNMDMEALAQFRDRFNLPIKDEDLEEIPFCKPEPNSAEMQYLRERREALNGYLPSRTISVPKLKTPSLDIFKAQIEGSGEREASTTMAMVRIMGALLKDKTLKKLIVPIVPDEARTFGMEGMFRQVGIYSSMGQLYTPQDADQLMYYREDKSGQILQEGINEAGATCSWMAAGTAYANHGVSTIPFYIYYSMFGFQRVGDFLWAAGDMQARGFLIGGTAGRTTLAGEGLQHQDGHSLVLASTIPNCVSYDPAYAYELAVIVHDGLRRMYENQENVFYYIACMNENYVQPALPEGANDGILKGMYKLHSGEDAKHRVQLMGSGTILREVLAAEQLLREHYDVAADVWSVTSYNELRRDASDVERRNNLNPTQAAQSCYVADCFAGVEGPFVAASDYMQIVPDQIRQWVPGRFVVLGTDGFGRSDGRAALRRHFEVDRFYIAVAALKALADEGKLDAQVASDAIDRFGIDRNKINPRLA